MLEEDGVETPLGQARAPASLLKRATIDLVLRASGLNQRALRVRSRRCAQARRSNELCHFDMRPSDLKQVDPTL